MARKLRLEYEGALYHVMNRGDRQEPIFLDAADARMFIKTLGEACLKTDWEVHSFCLMINHFHLVVETPRGNLVAGMKWLLGTYTGRFNQRHKFVGHLFSGRYKSLIVDGGSDNYLRTLCHYVHLNPARANLLQPSEALKEYPWSSFPEYLKPPRKRIGWLRVDRLLGELGIPKDSTAGRRRFERLTEERREADNQADFKGIRRGWALGDKAFRKELLAQMSEAVGPNHYGEERRESLNEKAERIVADEMKRLDWTTEDLKAKRKGDLDKVRIAQRLRAETTISLNWIAQRLEMGTPAYVNNRLYLLRQKRLGS